MEFLQQAAQLLKQKWQQDKQDELEQKQMQQYEKLLKQQELMKQMETERLRQQPEAFTQPPQANTTDSSALHTLCEYISEDSPFANLMAEEVETRGGCKIMAIQRDGEIIVPTARTKIRIGDTLISQRTL